MSLPDIGITGLDNVSRSDLAVWVLQQIDETKALRAELDQQRTRAEAAEAELHAEKVRQNSAWDDGYAKGLGRAKEAEAELRDLRKALAPAAGQPHRFVAVVGACSDRVEFARLIRVVGPFETAEAAKAAGEIECGRHQPDAARDDEVSIEFEVVAWQEVSP